MNWYKTAQIAYKFSKLIRDMEIEDEWNFEENVKDLHELEYKAHRIEISSTYTHPKRKENILNMIHDKAWDYFDNLRDRMQEAFENWKNEHQISDAYTWAEMVYNSILETGEPTEEETISFILRNGITWGQNTLQGDVIADCVDPNYFRQIMEEDISSYPDGYEYEIEKYLNEKLPNWTDSDADPTNYFQENCDIDDFMDYYMKNINVGDEIREREMTFVVDANVVKKAIAEYLYPQYMSYWGSSVEEIIENVDKALERLEDIDYDNSIKDMTTAISLAMNVMHVSGNIGADYLGYGQKFLDEMSELDVTEWEEEVSKEFAL